MTERFANAVLEGCPTPLFGALRGNAPVAADRRRGRPRCTELHEQPHERADTTRAQIVVDGAGARVVLRLGRAVLCTLPFGPPGETVVSRGPIRAARQARKCSTS